MPPIQKDGAIVATSAAGGSESGTPWNRRRWFLVDSRNHVRARINKVLRCEAESFAELAFGERMRAMNFLEISPRQYRAAKTLRPLTPQRCLQMFGLRVPVDHAKRDLKLLELRAAKTAGQSVAYHAKYTRDAGDPASACVENKRPKTQKRPVRALSAEAGV
jgi:hypothetical protein